MWIREEVRPVRLGEWTFALHDDDLAGIAYRGRDVLRSVRAVVRDRDWATAVWDAPRVELSADGRSARIALASGSFDAALRALMTVEADGPELTVSLEAHARQGFLTNRTGLVALHPPALAGSPLIVTHSDGAAERIRFPDAISPHQPAVDIAALSWDGARMECSGDTFEMEDQRNWTDASFKTYSRPLSLPFPYPFPEVVAQRIRVTADADAPAGAGDDPARIAYGPEFPAPTVSVGAATAPDPAPASAPVGADLLVELDLAWAGWPAALARAARVGLPLDVRLVLPGDNIEAALGRAARALAGTPVARIAAFWPAGHAAEHIADARAAALVRDAMAETGREIPVVCGTRAHFTELNREQDRLPPAPDGVAFSSTPLFHTRETRQLEEAVSMQRLVALQAVEIARGAPVHVGPVTLRAHLNNVATTAPPRPPTADLAAGYGPELIDADDPRQAAPELAAWTVASAAALAVPGVRSLSFFEEWGPRGIRTSAGEDLPVTAAVRALADLAPGRIRTGATPDGRAWAIRAAGHTLIANLTDQDRKIDAGNGPVRVPARSWRALSR
ncbi:hypothetical protein [Microbacterium excoecariae]|uniref:hypothetical protein n=1 Tax=Microbacterium excoecariae TaxID=2715210 RepID=UPI00140D6A42|nr:hypothetical protein [Microbacterium excoecariae]NHI15734.1 hypothetical protein [Microbacterium excoecariae]